MTLKRFLAIYLVVALALHIPLVGRFFATGGAQEQDIVIWAHYPALVGEALVLVPLALIASPLIAVCYVALYAAGYAWEEGHITKR